ncbi:MAG: chromosomal replication initiator protein DnaA [Planctomycetes bacterium]|nr:chromosomal replication initiator protein DnaA [Planctomycetota bacterium]NOG55554.1 chromosomal replication initiator protein DnaA [Planctomycetota bacterium]
MADPDPAVWQDVLAHLRRHYPSLCRYWFEDIEPLEIDTGVLRLYVEHPIHLKYLQTHCTNIFTEAAQAATGHLVSVSFTGTYPDNRRFKPPTNGKRHHTNPDKPILDADSKSTPVDTPATDHPETADSEPGPVVADSQSVPLIETKPPETTRSGNAIVSTPLTSPDSSSDWHHLYDQMVLNPDYTFENFVVGPTNRLAHAASIAVAEQPGRAYNPFFIHGGVGLGKTHLLQAACQRILATDSQTRFYYTSCDSFLNQFIEAVKAGEMSDFRHHFRNIDILVVDDIHDLTGHDRSQEEFFHTFNALHQRGKQIVLSSDAAPSEIPHLEARLVSRFQQGLVARIDPPCYETRIGILKSKAAMRSLALDDDVVCFIAQRVDSNIRELEGALSQLQGMSMALNRPINLELAHEALGNPHESPAAHTVSIQVIITVVCHHFELRQSDLLSKRRHRSIATPRQIAMYFARQYTDHSLEEVGGYFGGRDHTTVMHAERKIADMRESDESFDRFMKTLEQQLRPGQK